MFRTSALRAQRELEQVGITFPATDASHTMHEPPGTNEFSIIHRKSIEQTALSRARGPTSFRFYAKKTTDHPLNGKTSSPQRTINA
jgi:hypothetical protein